MKRHTAVTSSSYDRASAWRRPRKKTSSGRNLYANLEMTPIWKCCHLLFVQALQYICQDPRIARAYTAQNTKKAHFPLVSRSVYPRSRRGAERIRQSEGRWSRPPKTALERSYLAENSSYENRILRGRDGIKFLTESAQKRMMVYDRLFKKYVCSLYVLFFSTIV